MAVHLLAFDADDTLWHNEVLYQETQRQFIQLIHEQSGFEGVAEEKIIQCLFETEMRNLERYGYGIKSFTLSMVETSVELTQGGISGSSILKIVRLGQSMMQAEVRLLEGVKDVLARLASKYEIALITKGDLLDQRQKIHRSGLSDYFTYIEIVHQKSSNVYREILEKIHVKPEQFLMVGNSIKSDILPVLEIGGNAVYIPYEITWAHEHVHEVVIDSERYFELDAIGQLPELLNSLDASSLTKRRGKKQIIRALSLCVFRNGTKILVFEGYDPTKQQVFYRPLGGGINFFETSQDAIHREIQEELGRKIEQVKLLGVIENLFMFDGKPGHEVVFIYDAVFCDRSIYEQTKVVGFEGQDEIRVTWLDLSQRTPDSPPLYPDGMIKLLK